MSPKPTSSTVSEPTPVVIAEKPVPVVAISVESNRKALEKELQGIRAKLRWTHLTDGARTALAGRQAEIEKELASV
jgi:hypothetical protein